MRHALRPAAAAVLLVLAAAAASADEAPRPWPERLSVDFTNREQRSLSVAIGRLHGVESGMDFSVIDSTGRQVAVFFPDEIRPERFWSNPLPRDQFERVAVGQTVARVRLAADDSERLRRDGAALRREVETAARRDGIRRLREELAELDEAIEDLRVLGVRLARNRGGFERELSDQRASVQPRVAELEALIDELMGEWTEKEGVRRSILERKAGILGRSTPSRSELDRVERDLTEVDRRLGQVQARLREAWDQRQLLLDSIDARIQQRLQAAATEEEVNLKALSETEDRRKELIREIETQEGELRALEQSPR